jgi:hypothetical protein
MANGDVVTPRRKEKSDFEQALTEVAEISVSSLSSCLNLLCPGHIFLETQIIKRQERKATRFWPGWSLSDAARFRLRPQSKPFTDRQFSLVGIER